MTRGPEQPGRTGVGEVVNQTIDTLEGIGKLNEAYFDTKADILKLISTYDRQAIDTQYSRLAEAQATDQIINGILDPLFKDLTAELKANHAEYSVEFQKKVKASSEEIVNIISTILQAYTESKKELDLEALAKALKGHITIRQIAEFLNQDNEYSGILEAYLSGNTDSQKGKTRLQALNELSGKIIQNYTENGTDQLDFTASSSIIFMMSGEDRYAFFTDKIYSGIMNNFPGDEEAAKERFINILVDFNKQGVIGAAEMIHYVEILALGQDVVEDFQNNRELYAANWKKYNDVSGSVKQMARRASYGTFNQASQLFAPKNVLAFLMYTQSALTFTANVGFGIVRSSDKSIFDFGKNLLPRLKESTVGNHNTLLAVAEWQGANLLSQMDEPKDPKFDQDAAEYRFQEKLNGGGAIWSGFESHFSNSNGFGVEAFHQFLRERCTSEGKLVKARITAKDYEDFLEKKGSSPNLTNAQNNKYLADLSNFRDHYEQSFDEPKEFQKIGEMIFELKIGNQSAYQDQKRAVLFGKT